MRILYLSQYFPPEPGASGARAYDMAQALLAAGHQVTMIAEVPNHPHGVIPPEYQGEFMQRHQLDGIDVIYVWVKTSQVKTFRNRILFYLSYMLTAIWAGLFVARGKYDLVFATSPPLFVGFSGIVVSFFRRLPYVFEAIDLWPEAAVTMGELNNPRFIRWATKLEEWCYRRGRKIIVTAQEMVDRLVSRGIPAEKLVLVRNGAKLGLFEYDEDARHAVREQLDMADKFIVLYAGLHGLAYDLVRLMEVAKQLETDDPAVHFLLIGHGVAKEPTQQRAQELGIKNVTFLPVQPREDIPRYFSAADILIVPMREPHIVGTLPVKIYDAMACELPVLVAASGEPQMVVEEAEAGLVVPPEDLEQIRVGILELRSANLRQLGRNGRAAVLNRYTIQKQAEIFVQVLESVITR